jgi:uncharacterized protein YdiU (UPF0061 family)
MNREATLPFDNSYAQLPERFYARLNPTPVSAPGLIRVNHELARHLGIDPDWLESEAGVEVVAGNRIPDGAEPIATVYAGHQFGSWVPQLGDGRAILLGEIVGADGVRYDIQLKGSGCTPFSRGGDGRAPLGPVLREYIVSEAMAALGIATTRTLAAVITGDHVMRDSSEPSGVLARVAQSHIRIGTFEFFAARQDLDALRLLVDHVIQRHYPEAAQADNPCRAILDRVVARQAELIASWQMVGFIHGVMNTDNMSIAGETIDYGPCAFMDFFDHNQVYSSIDQNGRYAYSNQPNIGVWNLSRLGETLLPLFDDDPDKGVALAQEILEKYFICYSNEWLSGFRAKCGLTFIADVNAEEDQSLLESLLDTMAVNQADFTLTFYNLSQLDSKTNEKDAALRELFAKPEAIDEWLVRWRQRLSLESTNDNERQASMQSINPVYIPRNHQVEAAIRAAEDHNDFSVFHALYDVLQKPFERQQGKDDYMLPPKPDEVVEQTFCGT